MAPDRRYAEKIIRIEARLRRTAEAREGAKEEAVASPPPKVWRKASDAAKWLKISTNSVYREIRAGHLEAIRLGSKTLRISQDALDAWVEDKRAVR